MDKLEEKINKILNHSLSFRYVGGISPETGNILKYINPTQATKELKSFTNQQIEKKHQEILKWAKSHLYNGNLIRLDELETFINKEVS